MLPPIDSFSIFLLNDLIDCLPRHYFGSVSLLSATLHQMRICFQPGSCDTLPTQHQVERVSHYLEYRLEHRAAKETAISLRKLLQDKTEVKEIHYDTSDDSHVSSGRLNIQ